jgi:hypothetical protein
MTRSLSQNKTVDSSIEPWISQAKTRGLRKPGQKKEENKKRKYEGEQKVWWAWIEATRQSELGATFPNTASSNDESGGG